MARTLFEKIWDRHVAGTFGDGRALITIDRHVVQETRRIAASVGRAAEPVVTADLEQQRIVPPGDEPVPFRILADRRAALLAGQDDLDILLDRVGELDIWRATAPRRLWPDHG